MNATNVLPSEKLELNETDIKKAKPGDTLWDIKYKGLHLRVQATKKTYYLYYRTKAGVQRKPKIGDYGSISLAQARKVAGEILTEVGAGRDPGQTRIDAKNEATLTDLWDEYWKRHGKKKKSSDEDERLWLKNLAPLAKKRLSEIDYSEVADLHEDLTENNGGTTANRTVALLSTMFSFAIAPLEWTEKNPCKGVARNKETKRKRYMAPQEAARIAAVLHSKIDSFPAGVAFIYLLILTGARKSEIANARWDQLHGNKLILTDHKTDQDGEARVIQLPQAALDVVATRYINECLM
ncbi:MAG: integrase family protein, partial [Betaproteobacteria bacterium]